MVKVKLRITSAIKHHNPDVWARRAVPLLDEARLAPTIDMFNFPRNMQLRKDRGPATHSSTSGEWLFQFHIKALSALARLRLLSVLFSTPRSLNPRRLEIILDLELELAEKILALY